MKIKEFKSLKIGDSVYIPKGNYAVNEMMSTEVLGIDRVFNKIKVLCHSKPLSYRYVSYKTNKPVTLFVGTCK